MTLSGIVILVRPMQTAKAEFSMVVTLSGIVKLARLLQLAKAKSPMLVTLIRDRDARQASAANEGSHPDAGYRLTFNDRRYG